MLSITFGFSWLHALTTLYQRCHLVLPVVPSGRGGSALHGIRLCSQVACSSVSRPPQLLISSIACIYFWLCTACGYTSCGAAWTSPSVVLLGLDFRELISSRFVVGLQELSSTTIVGCRVLRTLWRKLLQLSRHHYNPLKPACRGSVPRAPLLHIFPADASLAGCELLQACNGPGIQMTQGLWSLSPALLLAPALPLRICCHLRLRSLHLQFLKPNFELRSCRLQVCCFRDLRAAGRPSPCLLCQCHLRLQIRVLGLELRAA